MSVNRRISVALVMAFVLLFSTVLPAAASNFSPGNRLAAFASISFVSNIETIGVAVSGTGLPSRATLSYRQSGVSAWQSGHQLMRIDDGRLIGSLFDLSPSTSYEIKVTDGSSQITGSAATQPEQLPYTPSTILHVDDNALPGGDGSAAAPFQTIQEGVDQAGPGTQVLVADGLYREAVTFPNSGAAGNWIQVKAAGNAAILDSSDRLTGSIWTSYSSHVWFTRITGPVSYLAKDGKRSYQYDDRTGLMQGVGHEGVAISEGWYYETSTSRLYVRNQDDPASHTWRVPRLNHAFDVNARDWIWIEGFEIRYYGRCGVCTVNASHLVVRRNKIHNMQLGVFFNWSGNASQGNDTRVEQNEISDPGVGGWPWKAVKGSYMEGTGIIVRGRTGAIVRENTVFSYFNGIYTGSSAALENPELAFDADIYNNNVHHVIDDAFEPEGACVNHRFRNNVVDLSYIGVSIAPVTQGPTWVLRSVITNYNGRAIKFANNTDGIVLIYHNTAWTPVSNINGIDLITAMHNVVMRNNIIQTTAYSIYEVPTGSTTNDLNNNNWYTTRGSAGPHFKWENVDYNTISALCSARGLECNGYETVPGFTNPAGGDFTLLPSSPNIDRGGLIAGINDAFVGNKPDVGAFEATSDPMPTVLSSVRLNPSPTNAASVSFKVTFSEPVTGVDLAAPFNDFNLVASSGISGAVIATVSADFGSVYTVGVNTGTGDGTLRLDVVDDDSILNSGGNPLGGMGAGNGDFNTGETYTINKSNLPPTTMTFNSIGTYDGWVLESGENTNAGGKLDRTATTFFVGDNPQDRQYRGILSFNTSSLPDNAVIVSAQVKVKRQGIVGTDPFGTHVPLLLEIRNGSFSNNLALQTGDFSAAASSGSVRDQITPLTSSWYAAQLNTANLPFINKTGTTQFRLFFTKDDNDDLNADYIKYYTGNSTSANAPQLIVGYYIP